MEEEELEEVIAANDPSVVEVDPFERDNSTYDDEIENETQQKLGPETGGASGESESPEVIEETLNRPVIDPRISEEQRNIALLQRIAPNAKPPANDPVPWPETGSFVNDFNSSGLYSMSFPCLFPYGKGDPSNRDCIIAVSENNCGKHLIKYAVNIKKVKQLLLSDTTLTDDERINVQKLHRENDPEFIYPFVKHERFIHFLQNTNERHRAFSQRGFWLSKHSEFGSMDEIEMAAVINQGGEQLRKLLGSMQSYNANINGSPQYLYQKRKLLDW